MSSLFESFLATPEVSAALEDSAVIEAMLSFEAALARAQASVGLIDPAAAQSIIGTCKVELFDVPMLVRESARLRCLVTPLLNSLRETVALFNRDAASLVHFGASHRDLADTALAMVTRHVLGLIQADLAQTINALLLMAAKHAGDAIGVRAPSGGLFVTSFGLTCCQWVAPLVRSQQRLLSGAAQALTLQLGSSITTLADMQGKDALVMVLMASELQLKVPDFAGHASSDETVVLACELGLLVGNLGKVAADMAHMAQFEVGELTQFGLPAGSVPGAKPVPPQSISSLRMVALDAAQRVPQQVAVLLASLSQESGNAQGNWQTQLAQWPALLAASQSITRAVAQMVSAVQVDTQRMRANLDVACANLKAKEVKARFGNEILQQAAALTQTQVKALLTLQAGAPAPTATQI